MLGGIGVFVPKLGLSWCQKIGFPQRSAGTLCHGFAVGGCTDLHEDLGSNLLEDELVGALSQVSHRGLHQG